MGQYLAIGLTTKISVKKSELDNAKLDAVQLQELMQQQLHYVPDLYTVIEDDKWCCFLLNEDIFYTQLPPFLKTLYPLLYSEPTYYDGILRQLIALPPSKWIEWAMGKPKEAFQHDHYGMRDTLKISHVDIHIYYESLLLSMEGKIVMETFGRQFNFLKYSMTEAFKEFSLAGALRIYITG